MCVCDRCVRVCLFLCPCVIDEKNLFNLFKKSVISVRVECGHVDKVTVIFVEETETTSFVVLMEQQVF